MGAEFSRPIKVLHIIARMNVGGPAVEIAGLMRGLDPTVVSQRLVTGYVNDDEADFLETQAPDIEAMRIDGLGRRIRPTDDAKTLATLTRIIRDSKPDIVHTHTAKAGVLGRLAAKTSGTGTRIIHTYHGHLLHGYFGPAKTKAVIQLERKLSKITDTIITVGDKVKDDLLKAGVGRPAQYTVIRSGIELGPLPSKQAARRELGLPEGPVIISMIGRLTRIKRPDRFAEVAKITKQRGLNAHFLVAGSGDQEQILRDRVERDLLPVTMLGWRRDLERILAATDIVLLTSDNEGTPLILIQAAQAGIAAVATKVGDVDWIVRDGITGRLCDRDSRELANALQDLVVAPELARTMGKSARDWARVNNSEARFLKSHLRVYGVCPK